MRNQYSFKCQTCKQICIKPLILDCQHFICLSCLDKLLQNQQKQQALRDQIDIQCPVCSYQTSLAVPLAYKLVRPLRARIVENYSNNCHSMVCINCFDQCFSLEDYLSGRHQHHEVESIDKASQIVKRFLTLASKSLQQKIDSLYSQNQKLCHCKNLLNDIFNANIIKIKIGFESLKEEISRKQSEIIEYYQEKIGQKFELIDLDITVTRKRIEECKNQFSWISNNITDNLQHQGHKENYQIVNYFIKNRERIGQLSHNTLEKHYQIPNYQQLLRTSRQTVSLNDLKSIIEEIRTLEIIDSNGDRQSTCSAQSLGRQYFMNKKKAVLNNSGIEQVMSNKIKTDREIMTLKIQAIKDSLKPERTLRKIASLKSNLNFL